MTSTRRVLIRASGTQWGSSGSGWLLPGRGSLLGIDPAGAPECATRRIVPCNQTHGPYGINRTFTRATVRTSLLRWAGSRTRSRCCIPGRLWTSRLLSSPVRYLRGQRQTYATILWRFGRHPRDHLLRGWPCGPTSSVHPRRLHRQSRTRRRVIRPSCFALCGVRVGALHPLSKGGGCSVGGSKPRGCGDGFDRHQIPTSRSRRFARWRVPDPSRRPQLLPNAEVTHRAHTGGDPQTGAWHRLHQVAIRLPVSSDQLT